MAQRVEADPRYGPSSSGNPEKSDDLLHRAEVLGRISLHGGLATAWPVRVSVTSRRVAESLIERWRAVGLPDCCKAG
jgi:hypothetical protein